MCQQTKADKLFAISLIELGNRFIAPYHVFRSTLELHKHHHIRFRRYHQGTPCIFIFHLNVIKRVILNGLPRLHTRIVRVTPAIFVMP